MSYTTDETNERYLTAVARDARGDSPGAIAELKQLVPDAHADLLEVVLLELMKLSNRIGSRDEAVEYAKKIVAIDSDPPPSVRKILGLGAPGDIPHNEAEPDFVSGNPGEHVELSDGSAPDHFYAGKRRFDVEYREEANGVHFASAEIFRAKNGVLYDANQAPFDVPTDEIYVEEAEGTSPSDAFEALRGKIEE
jgi:hypothetical protein